MITAVYTQYQPTNEMQDIIRQSTVGDNIISNFKLDMPHVQYLLEKEKSEGKIWGEESNKTHLVRAADYPFNWMSDIAAPAALISALAKDSDRIIMVFSAKATIPPLYVFLAQLFNNTVRVYHGGKLLTFTRSDIVNHRTQTQYDELILPELQPMSRPTELMSTPNGATLRPYQQQMVNFAMNKAGTGWFVDMGLGKTLAALVLIDQWIKQKEIDPTIPILIVAPIMVALDTWGREVTKWGYDWDVKINIRNTPKKRDAILRDLLLPQEKPTLFLTNPDQLEAIRQFYFSRNIPLPFEVLVIDELSMFKSPTAKRNDAIAHYRARAHKFLGLTGTPSSNKLLDVWNQLKIINRHGTPWAKDDIYQFQDTFFKPVSRTPQGFVRKWKPKVGAEEVIYRNLSKDVVSMRTDGLVELPSITYSNINITLPKSARKEYDTLSEDVREELDGGSRVTYTTEDGFELILPNSDVLQGKLLQLAGGALYTDLATHSYDVFHDEKLDALEDIVDASTSPLIVFYYYKSDFERIQKRFKNKLPQLDSKDPNVKKVIEQWNDGEIPVLLAHPASVGHGLNLQDGGHTIVWFTLPNWNNDYYQQANKRLHRSGQEHPVNILHIIATNTIDEAMLQSIKSKEIVNSNLMEALDTMERE